MLCECKETEPLVHDPRSSKAVNVFAELGCVEIIVCCSQKHVEHFVGGDMLTVKNSVRRESNIKSFLT